MAFNGIQWNMKNIGLNELLVEFTLNGTRIYVNVIIYISINHRNRNFVTWGQPFLGQDQIGSYRVHGF